MIKTEEAVDRYTDKAGTMLIFTTYMTATNESGIACFRRVADRRVEYEGMELERGFAITKFLAVKDFYWVQALMQGRELDCPFLLAALARLGDAEVIVEDPQPDKDILSLTKEFIHDHSQQ